MIRRVVGLLSRLFKRPPSIAHYAALLAGLLLLPHMLGQQLRRITQHIDRLKQSPGGLMLDRVSAGLPVAEMEKIRESLNGYQARLVDVHSSLDQKNRELWEMAHHDALTGARNRRAFDKYWHDDVLSADRTTGPLRVITGRLF